MGTLQSNPDDLSETYVTKTANSAEASDAADMQSWLQHFDADNGQARPPLINPVSDKPKPSARPLPEPKPQRTPSDDSLGRTEPRPKDESTAGTIARNVAEIPGQIAAGANSAVENAFSLFDKVSGGALSGMTDWLNGHVADLNYNVIPEARTTTGEITHAASEFMTGFVTSGNYLKALGVANAAVKGVTAGMIADFVTRNPHEGRLADLWKRLDLPQNVLTEYLASKPDDTETESRFKNALEGAGLGVLTEGVFLGARTLRGLISQPGVKKAEDEILRTKYGDATSDDYTRVIGDPTKPGVDIRMRAPSKVGGKVKLPEGPVGPTHEFEVWATDSDGGKTFIGKTTDKAQADSMLADELKLHQEEAGEGHVLDKSKDGNRVKVTTADGESESAISIRARKLPPSPAGTIEPSALIRRSNYPEKMLPENFDVYINFAAMDTPEKIKFAIGKMAEATKDQITDATRGRIAMKETEQMATDMGMTVPQLLARRGGQAMNAEEALAARQLWTTSGEQLVDLAKRAASPNAGPLDQYSFRKMMAVHTAIQNEVLGARAEAGRGLNSWKIQAGGGIEQARAINQVLEAMGGPGQSAEIAKRLSIMAEAGANPAAIARFAERGGGATTVDAIKEVWVNGLLSSLKTHIVNITGNTLVALAQVYERQAAEGVRAFVGGEGVVPGEAMAMAHGLIEGYKDAFGLAAKALKTGESGWALNKVDLARPNAISADAFAMSKETGAGRFVDFLGKTVNVPGRLLTAEDEFFKSIGYRMNVRAEALRTATREGLEGDQLAARYQALVDNPSESIRIDAADAALYQTFTNETGAFGRWLLDGRNKVPAITLVMPFVRTPVNIARYAFERTPFAPLVGQWRADIAAGGARADLALARMSTGTAIMLTTMDMADRGMVTGEGPRQSDGDLREALYRQGWKPYSVRVGDKWYSYNRLDPFGMTIGFAASIAEAVKKGEMDQDAVDEWQEVAAMSIAAVSQVAVSKTYLQGFSKFVEVMSDPGRFSQKYIDDLFASFLPATSLSSSVKNMVDPVQREVSTPWEAVQARIAGLSTNLTPRRDLWGKEITSASGAGAAYDFLSPVGFSQEEKSPIDREMVRLGNAPQRIQKNSVFDGVQANMRFYPQVYDEYTRLAGNALKSPAHGGLGAKDYLDAVVTGKHPISAAYNIMSDESRRDFVMHTIRDYRKEAQQAILQDPRFKDFASEISRLKDIHQQARMPVLTGE